MSRYITAAIVSGVVLADAAMALVALLRSSGTAMTEASAVFFDIAIVRFVIGASVARKA